MKKTDKAYIAGIIDGEGCISIRKLARHYQLAVMVGNTNEWLIRYLAFSYGGSIYFLESKRIEEKDKWQWTITSRKALALLVDILPYLQIKRPQAQIGILHQKTLLARYGKRNRWHPLSDIEKAVDKFRFSEIKKINKTGKPLEVAPSKL